MTKHPIARLQQRQVRESDLCHTKPDHSPCSVPSGLEGERPVLITHRAMLDPDPTWVS